MLDPDAARPPLPRPGGRTRATARVRTGAVGIAPWRGAGSVDWRGSVELDTAHCSIAVVDVEDVDVLVDIDLPYTYVCD